jgi:hypothetical protein
VAAFEDEIKRSRHVRSRERISVVAAGPRITAIASVGNSDLVTWSLLQAAQSVPPHLAA